MVLIVAEQDKKYIGSEKYMAKKFYYSVDR